MLAHKFIESLKAGPKEFIVANNPGPKSAMKSSPCIYEIKPLQVTVNANWRLTFGMKGIEVILVNYEDYH